MGDNVILVTGVTGYVGSHVAKRLLEEGYRVRGTVRSLKDETKLSGVADLVPNAKHPLELVEADLSKDDGWDAAVAGCTYIMHVASPLPPMGAAVDENELIKAARDGTLNIMKAAAKSGTVKRVVCTGAGFSVHVEPGESGRVYTEEDWASPDSPSQMPYSKSKLLAEKAAWEFVEKQEGDAKLELVMLLPVAIMGPVLLSNARDASSVGILMRMFIPRIPAVPHASLPICDVRDVAEAHIKAILMPDAAGKRIIIYSKSLWYKEVANILARDFRPLGYKVPLYTLPNAACWMIGCVDKSFKNFIIPRLGKEFVFSNAKMKEILGMEPRPVEETIVDMAHNLIAMGIAPKTNKYRTIYLKEEVGKKEKPTGVATETSVKSEVRASSDEPVKEEAPVDPTVATTVEGENEAQKAE